MAAIRAQVRPQAFGKKVRTLRLRVKVKGRASATVTVSDVMLQAGDTATGWSPHVTELLWSQGVVGSG